jgi:cytochrome c-type biogenesis protein CcmH/NrfF
LHPIIAGDYLRPYDEFTFYRPLLTPSVALMWAAPIILLVLSALLLVLMVRKRRCNVAMKGLVLSEVERNRLAGLLSHTISKEDVVKNNN